MPLWTRLTGRLTGKVCKINYPIAFTWSTWYIISYQSTPTFADETPLRVNALVATIWGCPEASRSRWRGSLLTDLRATCITEHTCPLLQERRIDTIRDWRGTPSQTVFQVDPARHSSTLTRLNNQQNAIGWMSCFADALVTNGRGYKGIITGDNRLAYPHPKRRVFDGIYILYKSFGNIGIDYGRCETKQYMDTMSSRDEKLNRGKFSVYWRRFTISGRIWNQEWKNPRAVARSTNINKCHYGWQEIGYAHTDAYFITAPNECVELPFKVYGSIRIYFRHRQATLRHWDSASTTVAFLGATVSGNVHPCGSTVPRIGLSGSTLYRCWFFSSEWEYKYWST